jgi:hypothetical protein
MELHAFEMHSISTTQVHICVELLKVLRICPTTNLFVAYPLTEMVLLATNHFKRVRDIYDKNRILSTDS